MRFHNTWIGYDLPYDAIEAHPDVRDVRSKGVRKRVDVPEHHLTLGHFESVELDDLAAFIAECEREAGCPLAEATFVFDGGGSIKREEGAYVYLSPSDDGAREAVFLKKRLASGFAPYDAEKNAKDLHVSVGGPDPFGARKPKERRLTAPLSVAARLVCVGNDGKGFRKFAWNPAAKAFMEIPCPQAPRRPAAQKAPGAVAVPGTSGRAAAPQPRAPKHPPIPTKKIILFPKIQPDTAAAVFLLRKYGETLFPGAASAEVEFMAALPPGKSAEEWEKEGVLLIDHGKSRFDHHTDEHGRRKECASSLVARDLGVADRPELRKLLAYVKRDDLEGKGTLSADPLDRAFGLSGLIMNLNRVHANDPHAVLEFVVALFEAHVYDEYQRSVVMPAEWKALKESGRATEVLVPHAGAQLRVVGLESDNVALPGFLRAYAKADVVVQRLGSGHTNVITRQQTGVDLQEVVAAIRKEEASRKGVALDGHDAAALRKPNHLEGVEEWFYDTAANTIQNGGVRPIGVTPTRIDLATMLAIVERQLRQTAPAAQTE